MTNCWALLSCTTTTLDSSPTSISWIPAWRNSCARRCRSFCKGTGRARERGDNKEAAERPPSPSCETFALISGHLSPLRGIFLVASLRHGAPDAIEALPHIQVGDI